MCCAQLTLGLSTAASSMAAALSFDDINTLDLEAAMRDLRSFNPALTVININNHPGVTPEVSVLLVSIDSSVLMMISLVAARVARVRSRQPALAAASHGKQRRVRPRGPSTALVMQFFRHPRLTRIARSSWQP
jgi:hypothetical protein